MNHPTYKKGLGLVWRPSGQNPVEGERAIDVLINDYGVASSELVGWAINNVSGISDDGSVIAGTGLNPNGQREAWVVFRNSCNVDAGADLSVDEGDPVSLVGVVTTNPPAQDITYSWAQIAGQPQATLTGADTTTPSFTAPYVSDTQTLTFELAVTTFNPVLTCPSATVNVTVADAGDNSTIAEGASSALDGTHSFDPDGDALTFSWNGPVTLDDATAAMPSFTAPMVEPGGTTLVFGLTVTDDHPFNPKSDSASVEVAVLNANDPPDCSLGVAVCPDSKLDASNGCLMWPPNHKLMTVAVAGVSDADNDDVSVEILGVTQDEQVDGLDDGDSTPDAVLSGDTVMIRAERSGTGNGRVYQVNFMAIDDQGGSCTGTVDLSVPHNRKDNLVDDGQLYDSTQP